MEKPRIDKMLFVDDWILFEKKHYLDQGGNNKKSIKKILTLTLTVVMLTSMLVLPVMAEGAEEDGLQPSNGMPCV